MPVIAESGTPVDCGLVGDIESVDADVLRKQLYNGLMPVVSPISRDSSGNILNINADTVTAAIDAALAIGVLLVHVISYSVADSLLPEVFMNESTGTLVVVDIAALSPAEQIAPEAVA